MKITDSPGAMLVMLLRNAAAPNEFELSSTFQPAMFAVAVPTFVNSNQSTRREAGLLPLDQGATSETINEGVPPVDSVTVRTKFALASGVLPTVGSSTMIVTL